MPANGKGPRNGNTAKGRDRQASPDKRDYEVGFKKPPLSGQIKPGERRNPNGRPKGSKNFNTILRNLMEKPMTLTIDGTAIKVSGREAIAYRVFQKAVSGDVKCIDILRMVDSDFEAQLAQKQAEEKSATKLSKTDEAILADYRKSILKKGK